jgi:hypothetical protein
LDLVEKRHERIVLRGQKLSGDGEQEDHVEKKHSSLMDVGCSMFDVRLEDSMSDIARLRLRWSFAQNQRDQANLSFSFSSHASASIRDSRAAPSVAQVAVGAATRLQSRHDDGGVLVADDGQTATNVRAEAKRSEKSKRAQEAEASKRRREKKKLYFSFLFRSSTSRSPTTCTHTHSSMHISLVSLSLYQAPHRSHG